MSSTMTESSTADELPSTLSGYTTDGAAMISIASSGIALAAWVEALCFLAGGGARPKMWHAFE